MPESILPVEWPSKGLVEGWSFSSQPEGTAREYQNVRFQDPVTARLRGGQRAGMSKYLTSVLKLTNTKGVGLVSFFVDNRQVTYSAIASGSETITWDEATPSKKDCKNVKTDRQGNVYALDGNSGIVKYSADGEKLWQLALPVKDPNHVVRALWVDEFDRVYAGVSEGGDQSKAALWAYEQIPDNKTEQLWEIETKAYIEDCKTSQDKLYTAQNQTDVKRAYVRVYDFIDETAPSEVQGWQVPHPVNSIVVKKDGAVVVACEASTGDTTRYWRDPDPRHPDFNVTSEDWTPRNLTDFDKRVWSWYVADDIDQTDVVTDIGDGVEILRWRDRTKNNRHWYSAFDEIATGTTTYEGPILAVDALNGRKAVRFNKSGALSATNAWQRMKTLPNSSISKSFADQQRTAFPAYTDSSFAAYIVCRPSQTVDNAVDYPRWLIGQDRDNAQSGADDLILFVNTSDANGNSLPPAASAGSVFWYYGMTVTNGSGTGGQIKTGSFLTRPDASANEGNLMIVSMIHDGGISGDTQVSLFQINGHPIDSFTSSTAFSMDPAGTGLGVFRTFGANNPTNTVRQFLGDVLEIIVLDRRSRSDASLNLFSTYQDLQWDSANQSQTANENTAIVGYLAHKYGAQLNLPYGSAVAPNFPHPFGITGSGTDVVAAPPNQAGTAASTAQGLANKAFACVVKYDAKGKIVWTANEMELDAATRTGGYGYAVALTSAGNIYSVGPNPTIAGGTQQVRLIIDQGTDFSIATADGAWSASYPSSANQDYHYPRIDVDEFDNLYVPYNDSANAASLRVYKLDGTLLHSHLLSASQQAFAVACDRRIPDYRSDLSATVKRCEHVILGTENDAVEATATLHKIRLVSSTQAAGAVRTLYSMAVSGGDVIRYTTSGVTTPTGGSGALDSGAKYVQGVALFKKAYWTDGRQLRFYEPITNAVAEYKCLSAGAIPSRCALIETWRGRIVLARSADEPHNWFMSRKDEPTNWDYFPPVPSEIDAVAGNNSSAGLCPDIINSVVPYSEDVLVFGGDHSLWALVGDPAAGGRLELVSDITGMAFGRPWCKDPNGVLYFVGSRGGLFRWVPGAKPERISLGRIERQLQDIDFATYHVKLAWNYQDDGVHIVQLPFGAGGTSVAHWFYEARADGFAKDVFGTSAHTNVQPTDVHVLDGDDFDDRVLVFACEDGHVRKWDKAAKSDDTQSNGTTKIAIDSFVTIFPIQAGEQMTGMETQFKGLTVVLGDREAGVRWELFSSDEPDSLPTSSRSGVIGPGRNPPIWESVVGTYCGLRLRNAAPEERWDYERAYMVAAPAGMARPRARN